MPNFNPFNCLFFWHFKRTPQCFSARVESWTELRRLHTIWELELQCAYWAKHRTSDSQQKALLILLAIILKQFVQILWELKVVFTLCATQCCQTQLACDEFTFFFVVVAVGILVSIRQQLLWGWVYLKSVARNLHLRHRLLALIQNGTSLVMLIKHTFMQN